MRFQRSASDIARELQEQFGYVVVASDDPVTIGEHVPSLETTRGLWEARESAPVTAVVTGMTTYEDYAKQAEFAGFGETCTDCMKHYFKVVLS